MALKIDKISGKTPEKEGFGIDLLYKPSANEEKMRQRVYDRFTAMRDSPERKKAEKEWKRGREQWEACRKDRDIDDWQSNHYVPVTTSIVETILSEVVDQSPLPLILPRGSEDVPKAMVMSHIFTFSWDVADGDLEEHDVLKDAFIEGTAIAQEYYWRDPRKIKVGDKQANGLWEEKIVYNFDDCYMESVPNDDFFVDEKGRDFSGPYAARDCIRRYVMDIETFRLAFDNDTWNELGNLKYVQAGGDVTNPDTYWKYYENTNPNPNDVEVLWYWCVSPDDWLVIVANDVVVFMGPNPYKHKQLPFARAVDIKRTHKFYGKGQAALLESIQDEVNTLRRMVIDRNHLDIDKMFFVSNRLGLADEDLIARPHGMIPVDDINAAKAVEYNDVPRSVEMSQKHLEDDATVVTGVNPRAQALPTTGTATEAAILKESTLKRIRLKLRLFERGFLTRIARLRVANILQYYSQPKLEKIVGEKGTAQYKDKIAKLQEQGLVVSFEGENYKKNYKPIRLKDKALDFDEKGLPVEKPAKGFTFFEALPDYFMPVARGGFDIRIQAGSTLPISKPLQQSKATEMYDRLIQLAVGKIGYDPVKLGDLLLTVNDYNPEDYHIQDAQESEVNQRLLMQIELAQSENNFIMQGRNITPTPYASPAHTRIHVQYTKSPQFQALTKDDPRTQIMIDHIVGEVAAQQQRSGAAVGENSELPPGGAVQGNGTGGGQSPAGGSMSDTLPAMITGGSQAPAAI